MKINRIIIILLKIMECILKKEWRSLVQTTFGMIIIKTNTPNNSWNVDNSSKDYMDGSKKKLRSILRTIIEVILPNLNIIDNL